MLTNIRNMAWGDAAHSVIMLVVTHPALGEIPFTADPTDTEAHGRDLFSRAVAGEFGAIAEYVAPEIVVTIPVAVSMRQARLVLHRHNHLVAVNAAIPSLGSEAVIEWDYAGEVRRDSPLVAAMGTLLSLDAAALDALFVEAKGIA